jgi:nicotinate-nucleotide adenylyltransferase
MRRIGLLGGTFDPPHVGHLVVAECARVELHLAEVRLLVAGDPWMKRTVSRAADRVDLVRAAVAGQPGLGVDAREVHREGPTYTVDSLTELRAEEPDAEWVFLVGTDAAARLDDWERIDEAMGLARFVVVTRAGHPLDGAATTASRLEQLEVPQLEVSSTDLRARYRDGRATRFQVPPAVDDLVRERGLYVDDRSSGVRGRRDEQPPRS